MNLISIVVPCYNQGQYLPDCLQSVLDQTYRNWECIIVDDGSPDETKVIAERWLEKDYRFKYLYQSNKGVSAARNFGIQNANGTWILPLDGDDYISNNYLELAVNHFNDSDIKVIYCNAMKFGIEDGDLILKDFSLKYLASHNLIFNAAFFRKTDWERISGYDANMGDGYEDWEFWVNLLKDGGDVVKLNYVCFFYRIKASSRNVSVKDNSFASLKYMEKKHFDFFYEHLGSIHHLHYKNLEQEKVLNILIHRRKVSRWINQVYSFIESVFPLKN